MIKLHRFIVFFVVFYEKYKVNILVLVQHKLHYSFNSETFINDIFLRKDHDYSHKN